MRVVGHDPVPQDQSVVEQVPLDDLVRNSDVISLHCALTQETDGLVNSDLLARTKRGAVLINAARGRIIESEDVLYAALQSGQLASVGLDVYPSEPPDLGHPLYADSRVICTPHTVGLTDDWNYAVFGRLARGLADLRAGRVPPNLLNPAVMPKFMSQAELTVADRPQMHPSAEPQ